jgi:DNA-directed RNA polymerase
MGVESDDERPRPAQPLRSNPAVVRRSDASRDPIAELEARFLPEVLPSDPRELAQLRREFDTKVGAYHKVLADWDKALDGGDLGRIKQARRLVRHWATPMAAYIEAAALKAQHTRGKRPRWREACEIIGPDVIAIVTVETILSTLVNRLVVTDLEPVTATMMSDEIGHEIEWATHIANWRKHNPPLFAAYKKRLDEAGATARHREEVLRIGLNKKGRDPEKASSEFLEATEEWPRTERVSLGKWLLLVAEKVTNGSIKLDRRPKGKGRIKSFAYYVKLDQRAWKRLEEAVKRSAIGASMDRAMVCPPISWRDPRGGGYLIAKNRSHIISADKPYIRRSLDVAFQSDEVRLGTETVFAAVNSLQRVPFAINEAVYDVASSAMGARLKLSELPDSFHEDLPPKPLDTSDKQLMAAWTARAAIVHRNNESRRSKALWAHCVMAEASDLRTLKLFDDESTAPSNGPFWFPHRLDFRSRIYAAGTALNPQGSDLARSLLRFHHGKPIGTGSGPVWLAAQVAKAFGRDKMSWEDRVRWTHDNEAMIERIADEPLGNRQQWENKEYKLWAALAAASEWTAYRRGGSSGDFVTTLPVFIDGTCNGLQHFAALSGDARLAHVVNLLPGDSPEDIYQAVADRLLALVIDKADHHAGEERRKAQLWLRVMGRDTAPRSLAKRVVMVRPYGGSHMVALEEVQAFLDEIDPKRLQWGGDVPTAADEAKLVGWLSKHLQKALGDRVESANEIMSWLQSAMRLLCEYGVADQLDWRTPAGWPWRNLYYDRTTTTVKVRFEGKPHETSVAENDLTKFDAKAATKGVAPNFVQALDATALMFAVAEAEERGVTDMMAIHDCVGGLAPDMDIISQCVRSGFVLCHEERPLETFREAVLKALPNTEARERLHDLPPRGAFDVRTVLDSDYFFS